MATGDLGIEERLRRKMGRPARVRSVATRFTEQEHAELLAAARRAGKTLREWSREALLQEARQPEDDPVFTEVIAIRLLLNNVLRPLPADQKMTADQFAALLQEVRNGKRGAAREVMATYTKPDKV